MKTCSLCKSKNDKLFHPEEKLLDTQLSSVIKFVFCNHSLEFPPKFLICTECSLALLQTEIVLKRLSEALPNNRNFIGEQKSLNGQEINKDKDEDENAETNGDNSSKKKNSMDWTFYCPNCEYTTTKPTLYKSHLKSKHKYEDPRIYKCMYCTESYQRKIGVKNHIDCVHENKPRPTRQRRKTIAFDSPNVLSSTTIKNQLGNDTSVADTNNDSLLVYDPNMPYEFLCTQCNYKTVQPKIFKRHMLSKHQVEDNRIYKCRKCPSTYARQFALNNHIAYEHEKKPKPQRRKSIAADVSSNNLADEEILVPKIEPEDEVEDLRCELCLYQADNSNGLKRHMVIVHQNDSINTNGHDFDTTNHEEQQRNEEEEEEEHVFQVPQKRSRNQLSFSENPTAEWIFQCSYCDFESKKKKSFKAHLSDVHDIDDSEVYKCTYCTAAYEHFRLLRQHVTNKHSIDLTSMSDTAAESDASYSQRPKKQKRDFTPIRSIKSIIIESEEEQTPAKSFKSNGVKAKGYCVVCGKQFSSVEKLRSHMDKRHGGDEIKKCQNCDAQFHSLEKYEAHLFSEKCLDAKLECQYPGCPKRFNRPSKMKQHMQEKHPDLID